MRSRAHSFSLSRFQPVVLSSGHIILDGAAVAADGEATFIHAVQGMRPNLVRRQLPLVRRFASLS